MINSTHKTENPGLGEKIAALALEYAELRVPYQHRGTDRNGCDCTGLIIGILQELGFLKEYILRQYGRQWNLHTDAGNYIIPELSKYARRVPKKRETIGDIALMWFGKCPAHCGVIVNDDLVFVHSLKSNKACKKSLLKSSQWSKRWMVTYRLIEEKLNV